MKRPVDTGRALRVWKVSGQQVASVAQEQLSDVRSLNLSCPMVHFVKRHLRHLCGCPRFRQRLLLGGVCLADDALLDSAMDLQLVLLPLVAASEKEAAELVDAAGEGQVAKVEEILLRPQDPDLREDSLCETPLLAAAEAGHKEVAQLLLEAGADVALHMVGTRQDHWDVNCYTPLSIASQQGHVELVRLLLDGGADTSWSCPQYKYTALYWAAEFGHADILHLLLEARANPEDDTGALGMACENDHPEVVRLLLRAGADKNRSTHQGRTPLHAAAYNHSVEAVRLLLEARADPNRRDSEGVMPIEEVTKCFTGSLDLEKPWGQVAQLLSCTSRLPLLAVTAACRRAFHIEP